VLISVSEGETTESGIDSLLENESNDDTVQLSRGWYYLWEIHTCTMYI